MTLLEETDIVVSNLKRRYDKGFCISLVSLLLYHSIHFGMTFGLESLLHVVCTTPPRTGVSSCDPALTPLHETLQSVPAVSFALPPPLPISKGKGLSMGTQCKCIVHTLWCFLDPSISSSRTVTVGKARCLSHEPSKLKSSLSMVPSPFPLFLFQSSAYSLDNSLNK
jgi:hypothetical protein